MARKLLHFWEWWEKCLAAGEGKFMMIGESALSASEFFIGVSGGVGGEEISISSS